MTGEESPERERAALDLLERTLAVAEEERARFLAEAAAGDEALRARVAALLPLHSDLGPAPWAAWVEAGGLEDGAPYEAGARIGGYEIVRPLAWGGMGRVYEARQESPRRRVALKVLRRELESREMERRFRNESEVIARLGHPGIAAVHEAGLHREETATGPREVPWIALEYVPHARPIDAFADGEALDARARLELFLQVLDAVQHGHERGVVHRDLKPSNVLVDASGRVRLIDFGVARLVGEADERGEDRTVHGELVGTLRYMSPEQATGSRDAVDAQSDVYALGVVLYELLCGRHPHDLDGLSLPAAARVVAERAPLRPRRVVPGLDRDLEAVLLQALEKEKGRRYPSAAAFADDVRAFLAGRAVAARRPGAGRRLVLFARRNPALASGLALVALVLVAATVVSVRFGLRERAARRATEELQQGLLDQSAALQLDFVSRLADVGGSLEVRRAMVDEAIDKLELVQAQAGDDPLVRQRLGVAYRTLGDLLGNPTVDNLGDAEAARACYERSLAFLEPLGAEDASFHATLTRLRLGQLAFHEGRLGEALPRFEAFLGAVRENEGADWRTPGVRSEQAGALRHVGSIHGLRGEFELALERFEEELGIRRALVTEAPDDPDRALAVSVARSKVGTARWSLGEPGGLDDLQSALDGVASLVERFPRVPRYRRTLVETATLVGDVLIQSGELEAAQRALERGLRESEELRRADPENAFHRRQRGQLTYNRGWLLREEGRRARGEGASGWRASLETSIEWLARSRDAWQEMAERGELQARERGNVARIDAEIEELLDELLEE